MPRNDCIIAAMNAEADPHFERLRFTELMVCLAAAGELAFGRSANFALHSCALGLRLAEAWGLGGSELRHVYYHALLRFIGCNADTGIVAAIAGDVIELRRAASLMDLSDKVALGTMLEQRIRASVRDASPAEADAAVQRGAMRAGEFRSEIFPGHIEVAQRLGRRLGFDDAFVAGLGQLYARWDGQGVPPVGGESLLPAVRVVMLVQELLTHHSAGGWDRAARMLRERSGTQLDPALAALMLQRGPQLMQDLPTHWEQVLALEPGEPGFLEGEALDDALRVLADYTDIQSPWLLRHSTRVSALAEDAARHLGMSATEQRTLRRAGWVHDIGRLAISADVWGRPDRLGQSDWDRVRMHSLYTAQILARAPTLAGFSRLASCAHERLDGSGHPRGLDARSLSLSARVLAAADAVAALGEARPHRPAFSAEGIARAVAIELRAGRLDRDAVTAVLSCLQVGAEAPAAPAELPAGLSARDAEVLADVAHGLTAKEIAYRRGGRPRAVGDRIEAVYRKIGVRTRAGATLFGMEHGLVARPGI